MPRIYDDIDLLWTSRGDYFIHDGDLFDTKNDILRSLIQEMKTRVSSDKGDWSFWPSVGSSISDFIGEPNTKITAEKIKIRLLSALSKNSFISYTDIKITYAPVDIDKVLFRIRINMIPTQRNNNTNEITLHSLYNYEENQISFSL